MNAVQGPANWRAAAPLFGAWAALAAARLKGSNDRRHLMNPNQPRQYFAADHRAVAYGATIRATLGAMIGEAAGAVAQASAGFEAASAPDAPWPFREALSDQ